MNTSRSFMVSFCVNILFFHFHVNSGNINIALKFVIFLLLLFDMIEEPKQESTSHFRRLFSVFIHYIKIFILYVTALRGHKLRKHPVQKDAEKTGESFRLTCNDAQHRAEVSLAQ